MTLQLAGTNPASTQTRTYATNGGYAFTTPLPSGSGWTVSVATQPAGQTCTVTGGTGSNLGADVTNANVTCSGGSPTIPITATAGAGGAISPTSAQVNPGASYTFTVTPNLGYYIASISGCGGTPFTGGSGDITAREYITGAITSACTVNATFGLAGGTTHIVTASAGADGTIDPSGRLPVPDRSIQRFTVTPNPGYRAVVGGTCGGVLTGTIYTTNAITADCTVEATFSSVGPGYTITVNAIPNNTGTINPIGTVTVNPGATQSFTVTPAANRSLYYITGTCGGVYRNFIYTTRAVNADCTVTAVFR
jgi:hypothetical protein